MSFPSVKRVPDGGCPSRFWRAGVHTPRSPNATGAPEKSKKRENALASRKRRGIDKEVPPFGSFGDWATPKRSAAELFFTLQLPFPLPPLFSLLTSSSS